MSGVTGIWRGTAGEGAGMVDVRVNLLASLNSLKGVLFFGVPGSGPLADVGKFNGSLTGTTVTLSTVGTKPVSLTGTLTGDQLTGTLKFTDPAGEVPVSLNRFALPRGYRPVGPVRVTDSRDDDWKYVDEEVRWVQVGGHGGVPRDDSVAAVLVNLTMTDTEGPGFLTAWSSEVDERPNTSNVNVTRAGATASNMAIVPVGNGGWMQIFSLSAAHVIVDLFGWFPVDSQLNLTVPTRLLDTRSGVRPGPGAELAVQITGQFGVPAEGVAAAVLNLTATESAAPGFITAFPSGGDRGGTSTVNVSTAGQTIANHAIVPVGADGAVRLFVSHGTHVIADLFGWFPKPVEYPAELASEGALRNGSFESWGSIPFLTSFQTFDETPLGSWFVSGGSVDLVGADQAIAKDGVQFVDLNGNSGYPGTLQQLVQTNPARRYKIGFWLAGNPADDPVKHLEVSFGSVRQEFSFDTTGHTNDDLGWVHHEFLADPDCSSTTMLTFQSLTEGIRGPNIDGITVDDAGAASNCGSTGYRTVTPTRILDTRPATMVGYSGGKPAGGSTVVTVPIAGVAGMPAGGVAAVIANLTATETDGPNFVTAFPSGTTQPTTSNVNLEFPGETRANVAVVPVGADGSISLTSLVSVHLIVDVLGYFG